LARRSRRPIFTRSSPGGLASLFGGTTIAIPFSLGLVNLPSELFNVFVSIDFIGSRLSTTMSVMHYGTIALIGTCVVQGLTVFRPLRILTTVAVGVALFAVVLPGVRQLYSHVLVVPYTADQALRSLQLLSPSRPNVVHTEAPSASQDGGSTARTYAEIVRSGILKVCYQSGNYPLTFFNSRGDLVGFDVEMAYKFAERLNLALEFLPLERLGDGPERLTSGYCDIVFSSTAKALNRMEAAAETDPIGVRSMGFVVPERLRNRFDTWQRVRRLGPIEVATSAFQILPRAILTRIPQATVVSLETLEEQKKYFASGGAGADAFLDTAEVGDPLSTLHGGCAAPGAAGPGRLPRREGQAGAAARPQRMAADRETDRRRGQARGLLDRRQDGPNGQTALVGHSRRAEMGGVGRADARSSSS